MKRILFGAKYSPIEPLGLLHLSSVAKQEGYDSKIIMVKDHNFEDFDGQVSNFNPEFVGFMVYTGNHLQTFKYLDNLKAKKPNINIILGGPHPTFFPVDSSRHADYVVLSEGFNGLRRVLKGDAEKGIVHLTTQENFPPSDREQFYQDYEEHKKSPIKSIISQTGCPYKCNYCYNSCTLETIAESLSPLQKETMSRVLAPSKTLFPNSRRSVDEIILEVENIKKISPETQIIYFQDDVFSPDIGWAREFVKKYPALGLPFHAQLRFEYADPKTANGRERIELLKEAGCTGLTFAIESANSTIRREVLNRHMKEDLMFEVMSNLKKQGYRVRTEQMLGLPCGATTEETKINIDADLETLELNVKLTEQTGLLTLAWASIFAPYRGTKIADYCKSHGFYSGGNNDVPDTFFQRSVLNFPKKWTGPSLSNNKKDLWLPENELEGYRNKMQLLRDLFNYFSLIPKGHELAKKFINQEDNSFFGLSTTTRRHLYDSVLYDIK